VEFSPAGTLKRKSAGEGFVWRGRLNVSITDIERETRRIERVLEYEAPAPGLQTPYRLSLWLLITSAITCAVMVVWPHLLHETAMTRGNAQGTALTILVVALPVMALGMRAALRGSWRGRLVWLGALTYILYNSIFFAYGVHFNVLFLLYAAQLSLAVFSLVTLLRVTDVHSLWLRFALGTPVRGIAVYLGVLQGLFALLWLKDVLPAIVVNGMPHALQGTGMITNPVEMTDFAFSFPLTALMIVLLWHRRPWGYLMAGAVLVYGVLETVSVAVDQTFGHLQDPSQSVAMVPVFVVMALIGLYPAVVFFRRLPR
jgi:hypothetical protein